MSEELRVIYRRALQMMIAQIVTVGLVVFFLGFLLPPNPEMAGAYSTPEAKQGLAVIRYAFLALSAVAFVFGPLMRKRILSQGLVTPPAPSNLSPVAHGVWRLFIVGMAGSGMPAIAGAVLFTLTRSNADLAAFSGLSAILVALAFPRTNQWEEWERIFSDKALR